MIYTRIPSWVRSALAGMTMLIVGVLIGAVVLPSATGAAFDGVFDNNYQITGELIAEMERTYGDIYNRAAPAVVSITALMEDEGQFGGATGSGFVMDLEGHIVTNYHVVEGATRVEINMFDGTRVVAEVTGTDPDSDIAVLKVDVSQDRLRPLPFGDSDALTVGQTALAIGNPFAKDWTLTSGIISALNRSIVGLNRYSIGGVIQTDAAINPGNSGGPLLNLKGEVIGINSQIEGGLRQNAGIGFAVPSNLVKRIAQELITEGRVHYSFLGISSRPVDLDLIEQFELPNNIRGVAVLEATDNYPAATAGIQTLGNDSIDIITAINGRPIRDFDDMIGYLAIHTTPGETVTLTIYRQGQVLSIPVTLIERPGRD
jgi:S1-C subfamily serine protease